MKLTTTCLFSGLLLAGCHKPLTPGQKLLLSAPTSSRPVLHKRAPDNNEIDDPQYNQTPSINMMH
jgi:hypothetical protein